MTTPFEQLVAAVRTAGNRAGTIRIKSWKRALASARALEPSRAAYVLARTAVGPAVDTATVRELELEIATLDERARDLCCTLAPALEVMPEESSVIQRALAGIAGASAAAIGAWLPWSSVIDATLLGACRACSGTDAEELARRVAHALGVSVEGKGRESPEESALALRALDARVQAEERERKRIEQELRAKLPRV